MGLEVEKLDLRDYFNQGDRLKKDIKKYGVIWVRGGNVFVLRQAMKLSGLDNLLINYTRIRQNLLYGGYSAGICVLGPTLRGLELVDSLLYKPYQQLLQTIWQGLGIINYTIIPHCKSNHPESATIDSVVAYYKSHKLPFKTLKDGEVIIIK